MDANKLEKLKQLDYKIQKSCSLCGFGEFSNNNWGTCLLHTYEHKKHSDSKRHLSIHMSGYCAMWSPSEQVELLGHFKQFISETK